MLGIFLVVIIGGFGAILYLNHKKRQASASWPEVEGEILSSFVKEHLARDAQDRRYWEYTPIVSYRYVVEGVEFHGDQIRFGFTTVGSSAQAALITDKFPEGAKTPVYYDPAKPSDCVLERGKAPRSQRAAGDAR